MPKLTGKRRKAYLNVKLIILIIWGAIYIIAYALGNILILRSTFCLECGQSTTTPAPKDLRYCRECLRKQRVHDKRRQQLFGGPEGVAATEERFPVKNKPTGKNGYKPER